MEKLILISIFLSFNTITFAQNSETIIVKAGTSLLDYYSFSERYFYPQFTKGKAIMRTGVFSERDFNYNFLSGEMDYLQGSDTVSISNKEDINFIKIAEDIFIYSKGFIHQIKNDFPKIGVKDYIEYKGIQKKDSYGISSSGSSSTSFNTLPTDANYFKLKSNQDMIFERSRTYYISAYQNSFIQYSKKNVLQLFPNKKAKIKSFLKTENINFRSEEDLIKLANHINSL